MRWVLRSAALLTFFASPAMAQDTSPQTEASPPAANQPAAINLELNKLEQGENACNVYMVVNNQRPEPLANLKIDVYLFNKQDVILEGLTFQFDNVASERQMVVPFELPDLACGDIGRMLLNKVIACNGSSGTPVDGCGDLLELTSRAKVAFE